jgi:hypothetical protein
MGKRWVVARGNDLDTHRVIKHDFQNVTLNIVDSHNACRCNVVFNFGSVKAATMKHERQCMGAA